MLPNLGPLELLLVMGVAVLLFGKRLPEVGRSLGKGIVEFKKGLRGIEEEFDLTAMSSPSSSRARSRDDHRDRDYDRAPSAESSVSAVPKFEMPATPEPPRMEFQPGAAHD
jgi:sec-independent protein translocase protein TatA